MARFQLSRFSDEALRHIAEKKRAHYTWLSERLSAEKGLTILWPELSEGIVPFCLSLLVESNRDFIFEELRKKYDVMAWPTLPQAVLDRLKDYPDVELLGRRLLQLNLPSDKVRSSGFPDYLKDLVRDMVLLLRG